MKLTIYLEEKCAQRLTGSQWKLVSDIGAFGADVAFGLMISMPLS
jgi:hypothetical protein